MPMAVWLAPFAAVGWYGSGCFRSGQQVAITWRKKQRGTVQRKMIVVVQMRVPARRTHLLDQKSSRQAASFSVNTPDPIKTMNLTIGKFPCIVEAERIYISRVHQVAGSVLRTRHVRYEEDSGFESETLIREGGNDVQRDRDDADGRRTLKGSHEDVGIEIIIPEARLERYEMVSITRINGMASTFSGLDEMTISA
ncbi:hypothetical protein EV421DRAFT_1745445 [Armillaria borealis]|uniref:Uncharacterized protein n=1 Tax=Armillaria borealis TaxID=47425 RepID=A0AA39IS98_9AGAR|nr:hypothetical protein EV421DRAFT_1745445 [Armillaria borealis]